MTKYEWERFLEIPCSITPEPQTVLSDISLNRLTSFCLPSFLFLKTVPLFISGFGHMLHNTASRKSQTLGQMKYNMNYIMAYKTRSLLRSN